MEPNLNENKSLKLILKVGENYKSIITKNLSEPSSLPNVKRLKIKPFENVNSPESSVSSHKADDNLDKSEGKRACVIRSALYKETPFQKCLNMILSLLENKDPDNYFASPVDDKIAPGYFDIIRTPMDFTTVRLKIENEVYTNLSQFHEDVKLIFSNAMTYNASDTVYYKAAKRLSLAAGRYICKEKFAKFRLKYAFIDALTEEQLGFKLHKPSGSINNVSSTPITQNVSKISPNISVENRTETKNVDAKPQSVVNENSEKNEGLNETEVIRVERQLSNESLNKDHGQETENVNGNMTDSSNDKNEGDRKKSETIDVYKYFFPTTIKKQRPSLYEMLMSQTEESTNENLTYLPFVNHTNADTKKSVTLGDLERQCFTKGTDMIKDSQKTYHNTKANNLLGNKVVPVKYLDNAYLDDNYHPFMSFAPFYDTSNANISKEDTDLLLRDDLLSLNSTYEIANNTDIDYSNLPNTVRNAFERISDQLLQLDSIQTKRLSIPLQHLSRVPNPFTQEKNLAEKIRSDITNLSSMTQPKNLMNSEMIQKTLAWKSLQTHIRTI